MKGISIIHFPEEQKNYLVPSLSWRLFQHKWSRTEERKTQTLHAEDKKAGFMNHAGDSHLYDCTVCWGRWLQSTICTWKMMVGDWAAEFHALCLHTLYCKPI